MIDHSLSEYMMAHRINFRNWRITDFDNTMLGNSPFAKQMTMNEFRADVEKLTGPKEEVMKTGKSVREFIDNWELIQNFLDIKEPTSNVNMPVLYHKNHVADVKAAAEAAAAL